MHDTFAVNCSVTLPQRFLHKLNISTLFLLASQNDMEVITELTSNTIEHIEGNILRNGQTYYTNYFIGEVMLSDAGFYYCVVDLPSFGLYTYKSISLSVLSMAIHYVD